LLVDPFTVGAQIVNFLILVWLLRRILYGPITRAMTARESRIREEVEEARRLRADAQAQGEQYRQQLAEFESERAARLAETRAELDAWRRTHTQAVRTEVEAMRQRWQQAIEQEKEAFLLELRHRAGREVLAAVRRALGDLADVDIEARMVARFLIHLHALSEEQRRELAVAARADGGQVHVRTALPLTDVERGRLKQAIVEALGGGLSVHVEATPDVLGGVEVRAGGLKVAWTFDDYVGAIEDAVGEAFGDGSRAGHGRP
jgi:F-type H+-transporting ATPase subunit b